jgi:hypothetical protein
MLLRAAIVAHTKVSLSALTTRLFTNCYSNQTAPQPPQSNSATQKYLESYESDREAAKATKAAAKAAAAAAKAAAAAAGGEGGAAAGEGGEEEEEELTDEQKDDAALQVGGGVDGVGCVHGWRL